MEKTAWLVLDELSDDYETFERIVKNISKELKSIETEKIACCVKELYNKGYIEVIEENGIKMKTIYDNMINIHENKLWYGLTLKGSEYWERNALKYDGQVINWDELCVVKYNYEMNVGKIYGASRDICIKKLNYLLTERGEGIIPDENSIEIVKAEEINVKYYKKIRNGYIITFKLRSV